MTIAEYSELLALKLVVTKRNFIEYLKVIYRYYRNYKFCKIDTAILAKYIFSNPFVISKKFLETRGEKEIYAYGETPLTTLEKICKECSLSSKDNFFELGAGRGRGCFWVHTFIKCPVVGIEYVPNFVQNAEKILEKFSLKNIEFRLENLLESDFKNATVIYLYGTCFDTDFIQKLIHKFSFLPKGTTIITVSYSLTEYTPIPLFEVMKCFSAPFTWGEGDVYIQRKL